VVTVPPWRPGLAQSVLPASYQDLLEVLADAGRPLRAGNIAAAARLSTDKSKIDGLRSKLKRLAERGWPRTVPGCSRCPAASAHGPTRRSRLAVRCGEKLSQTIAMRNSRG